MVPSAGYVGGAGCFRQAFARGAHSPHEHGIARDGAGGAANFERYGHALRSSASGRHDPREGRSDASAGRDRGPACEGAGEIALEAFVWRRVMSLSVRLSRVVELSAPQPHSAAGSFVRGYRRLGGPARNSFANAKCAERDRALDCGYTACSNIAPRGCARREAREPHLRPEPKLSGEIERLIERMDRRKQTSRCREESWRAAAVHELET